MVGFPYILYAQSRDGGGGRKHLGLGRLGVEGARRLEEVAKAWEREEKTLPAEKALGGRGRVVPADVADGPRYKGMSYTCLEDIVVL